MPAIGDDVSADRGHGPLLQGFVTCLSFKADRGHGPLLQGVYNLLAF